MFDVRYGVVRQSFWPTSLALGHEMNVGRSLSYHKSDHLLELELTGSLKINAIGCRDPSRATTAVRMDHHLSDESRNQSILRIAHGG